MPSKGLFVCLFLMWGVAPLWAQQEPQFSHNMFNNMGINPGYAGLRPAINATALARQQWVGFRDEEGNRVNPETYTMHVDAPIPFLRGGLALGFMQDQLGFETNVGVRLSYAYHVRFWAGRLGVGAQLGLLDKRIDFSQFKPISPGDPALIGDEENHIFTDFALGAFYMTDEEAWAGLSVSQVRQATNLVGESEHSLRRHAYLSLGYHLRLPGLPDYQISPSMLLKTDFSSFQADIGTMVTYNNRFWGGVSYRLQDAMVVMMGLRFEQISFGYAYDITTSGLGARGRSHGSHELMLQYSFNLDLDRVQEIQRNVRFL